MKYISRKNANIIEIIGLLVAIGCLALVIYGVNAKRAKAEIEKEQNQPAIFIEYYRQETPDYIIEMKGVEIYKR